MELGEGSDRKRRDDDERGGGVPVSYAERAMNSLMALHGDLMSEKERVLDLTRRLMEERQGRSELEAYVRLLEGELGRLGGPQLSEARTGRSDDLARATERLLEARPPPPTSRPEAPRAAPPPPPAPSPGYRAPTPSALRADTGDASESPSATAATPAAPAPDPATPPRRSAPATSRPEAARPPSPPVFGRSSPRAPRRRPEAEDVPGRPRSDEAGWRQW